MITAFVTDSLRRLSPAFAVDPFAIDPHTFAVDFGKTAALKHQQ